MILQALCSYYQRAQNMPGEKIIAPGYGLLGASAEIVLSPDGRIIGVYSLMELDPNDKQGKRKLSKQLVVPLPPKRSGAKPEPAFLYETVAFLFGIYHKPDGAAYRFDASSRIHHQVLDGCQDEGAKALLAFFDGRTPGSTVQEGVDTSLLENTNWFVVFRLQGDRLFLHERPAIKKAWEAHLALKSEDAEMIQCLVTGEMAPLAKIHGNVSGFGQDKPTLVGFNQDAFCSFGKYGKQGANAPVGQSAAFQYVTALNMLMKNKERCVNLAGDKVLFWAERDADQEEDVVSMLLFGQSQSSGQPELDTTKQEQISNLLQSIYKGKDPAQYGLDKAVRFYILGVSANKTRLVIRFFHQSTFGDLMDNLMDHYHGIEVAGARYQFPAPYFILLETALNRERANVAPNLEAALMRSIISRTGYPWPLYQGVLRRIRAGDKVTALGAGILKATINRQANKEVLKVALDPNEKDVPYVLGRLFALCEKAQKEAIENLNAGISDKYLNAALASPQMIFPTLLTLNKAHIAKTKNQWMERMVREVMGLLGLQKNSSGTFVFPETLDANGQGKFILGYHHQTEDFYTKKEKAEE